VSFNWSSWCGAIRRRIRTGGIKVMVGVEVIICGVEAGLGFDCAILAVRLFVIEPQKVGDEVGGEGGIMEGGLE